MQGQGRGVAQNFGVDIGSSSNGDKSKGYTERGRSAHGYGVNPPPFTVPANYGYGYGNWAFGLPLLSLPPTVNSTLPHVHGKAFRSSTPLGVQGGGILKKNPQNAFVQGQGHTRSHANGRLIGGGRGARNLTKEALDADLEEWKLKDKRFAGHSLDAELDDYWSKKDTTPDSKAET